MEIEGKWKIGEKTLVSKHFARTMSNFERFANLVSERVRPPKLGLNIEISRWDWAGIKN